MLTGWNENKNNNWQYGFQYDVFNLLFVFTQSISPSESKLLSREIIKKDGNRNPTVEML